MKTIIVVALFAFCSGAGAQNPLLQAYKKAGLASGNSTNENIRLAINMVRTNDILI